MLLRPVSLPRHHGRRAVVDMSRERLLARTIMDMADTLTEDLNVVDLLTTLSDRSVDVLHIDAAAITLVAPDGVLRLITSSSEAMQVVELFELQNQEGPCLDAYRSGRPVVNIDLERTHD